MPISRLNHTASALAVCASCRGFPSTGKTRIGIVAKPLPNGIRSPQEHLEGSHNQGLLLLPHFPGLAWRDGIQAK
jgi:hypothetical protein